ncbi:MAG: hypothetical protein PHS86_04975 [Syntrophaceae bacterium]|nr:hypothetical protein [Syntrophaceae bacterium]
MIISERILARVQFEAFFAAQGYLGKKPMNSCLYNLKTIRMASLSDHVFHGSY